MEKNLSIPRFIIRTLMRTYVRASNYYYTFIGIKAKCETFSPHLVSISYSHFLSSTSEMFVRHEGLSIPWAASSYINRCISRRGDPKRSVPRIMYIFNDLLYPYAFIIIIIDDLKLFQNAISTCQRYTYMRVS